MRIYSKMNGIIIIIAIIGSFVNFLFVHKRKSAEKADL